MVTSMVGDPHTTPPCEEEEEENPFQEALPLEPTDFSVTDIYFWQLGELPLGCVITFVCPEKEDGAREPCMIAVLVQSQGLDAHGHTLGVRFLGGMSPMAREWGIKRFSKEKKMIHLCREPGGDFCQVANRAIHVTDFCYWPPGRFNAEYAGKKFMKEMKEFLAQLNSGGGIPPGGEVPEMPDGPEVPEDKLAALRKKLLVAKTKASPLGGRRVSFSDSVQVQPRPGILKRGRLASPLKQEALEVLSSGSQHPVKRKKAPKQRESTIGGALLAAVERRNSSGSNNVGSSNRLLILDDAGDPGGGKKKSKKKKKKRKKKKKDSDGSSSGSSTSESSSSPLKPPLQKKAEKKPGSVLKLLMDHVRVALSDMSLLDGEGDRPVGAVTSLARVQSYFQILVRPHLQSRPRDEKELYSLAVAIDTLRGRDIQRLADMLAGRYLAVETAALEGLGDGQMARGVSAGGSGCGIVRHPPSSQETPKSDRQSFRERLFLEELRSVLGLGAWRVDRCSYRKRKGQIWEKRKRKRKEVQKHQEGSDGSLVDECQPRKRAQGPRGGKVKPATDELAFPLGVRHPLEAASKVGGCIDACEAGGERPDFKAASVIPGSGNVETERDPKGQAAVSPSVGQVVPDQESWRLHLRSARDIAQFGAILSWGLARGFCASGFELLHHLVKPVATRVAFSRYQHLFPLPCDLSWFLNVEWPAGGFCADHCARAWISLTAAALNHLHGEAPPYPT